MNQVHYNSRPTIRVGQSELISTENTKTYVETNRGVLIFDISEAIQNALSNEPDYVSGEDYSINHCSLTLTSINENNSGTLYAFMSATDCLVDESVSWTKSTEKEGQANPKWFNGGTIEPLTANITTTGKWINNDIVFDITPFVNIWKNSGKKSFSVVITSNENSLKLWEFHSQQSEPAMIGGKQQTNVRFFGAGDTNTISTEGIVVKVAPYFSNFTIEPVDSSKTALNRWSAFNASVSVGDTFSMAMPDYTTSTTVFTLLDKRSTTSGNTELIVSGSTTEFSTVKYGTAEFSCVGRVESGYGIAEFTNPDNSLKTDLNLLQSNETVVFTYKPTTMLNNAKSFTVDFYMDETLKNSRSRLYLKEQTVSENRNGLNTLIQRVSLRPRLGLSLLF